jgi:simple sugar transport system substrate-binding protein
MRSVAAVLLALFSISATADQATKPLRIILLTPFVDYGFFGPVKKGAQDAATALNVQVTFSGTKDGNVKELAAQVQKAAADGYDGIALNIIDPVAFDAVVAEAVQKKVPVIAFNVDDNRTSNARLAAVGQNMLAAGQAFGRKIAAEIPSGSHVLLTMHDPNISALEDRARGIKEVLAPKGIKWTELITSTDREQAVKKVQSALEADRSIKIVISTGSADTEATGIAIERFFPTAKMIAAGFDLSPDILRLVKAGVIRFTIDQQPYSQGYFSVVALTLNARYGLLPTSIDTGATIIDRAAAERVIDLSRRGYR